jgi:hypothetical protein
MEQVGRMCRRKRLMNSFAMSVIALALWAWGEGGREVRRRARSSRRYKDYRRDDRARFRTMAMMPVTISTHTPPAGEPR